MKKAPKTPKRRTLMEELEPRLLFSADLPGVLASAGLMDVDERPAGVAVTGPADTASIGTATSAGERPAMDAFTTLSVVPDAVATVTTNNTLFTTLNTTVPITNALLQVTDIDNTPDQIVYTVTSWPNDGQLELTSSLGSGISSFTQAQVDAGQVVYDHDGTVSATDSFDFTVSDSVTGTIGTTTFNITIINPIGESDGD